MGILLSFAAPGWAGAWPARPGSGKAALVLSRVDAASVIDAQAEKRAYAWSETVVSTYGEVGLSPRLALAWSWGLLKDVRTDSADALGVTDPELGLSWHLGRRGPWVFALQAAAAFALGPDNPSAAPDFAPPFFSPGSHALEVKPLAGWAGHGWWVQGGAGVRARSADRVWQFRYSAAGGRAFGKRLSGLFAMDGVVPLDDAPSGHPGDQEKYYGYHLGLDWRLSRAWQVGGQFDSMLTFGQELPLGARFSAQVKHAWP